MSHTPRARLTNSPGHRKAPEDFALFSLIQCLSISDKIVLLVTHGRLSVGLQEYKGTLKP